MPTLPLTPKGEIFPQALRLKHPAGGGFPLGVRGEKGDLTLNTYEHQPMNYSNYSIKILFLHYSSCDEFIANPNFTKIQARCVIF